MMRLSIRYIFSISFILILVPTMFVIKVEGSSELPPKWEYVAPEIDYFNLDGGFSQWSELTPVTITLDNMGRTGETMVLLAYFAYNDSKLYIGLYIPKQDIVVYGIEIIFIGNNGIFDGIIVDSSLREARDVAYVNTTHVAFDTDLGGYEDVNVQISEEGDDEFYMIVDDVRYPHSDLDSDWEFDDGDSVAVVFQTWGNKVKDMTNRPNFSTVVNNFNYLRLSINHDTGESIELVYPGDMSELSDVKFESYFIPKLDYVLDGKKDERFWQNIPSYTITTVLISKTASGSILNSPDPKTKTITCTFANDKHDLLIHLEIQQEEGDTNIDDLLLILGKEESSLQIATSQILVCKVNPSGTPLVFSTIRANISSAGINPREDPCGIVYFNISHWSDASGHFDLYEGDCSPFVPFTATVSIEIILTIIGNGEDGEEQHFLNPLSPQGYINGIHALSDDEVMAGEPAELYGEINLAEDQLKYVIHEIKFSDETFETTKTVEYELTSTLIIFSLLIILEVILVRKKKN